MQMTGMQSTYNKIVLGSAIAGLVFMQILIPQFGIVGAALSTASMVICQNLTATWILYRKTGIHLY